MNKPRNQDLDRCPSICAVIVTYHPAPAFAGNLQKIAGQVGQVIVVDNGSFEAEAQLDQLRNERVKVILNPRNLGLAPSLNLGVELAMQDGFDWICTFDQDSRVCDEFFRKMLQAYEKAGDRDRIALIAPHYIDLETGCAVKLRKDRSGNVLAAMTSGSLIPAGAIRAMGHFDESLYIDAVDKEFCLRIRSHGMLILESEAVLAHSLGKTTYHRALGLKFGTTNHSVERRYYIFGNAFQVMMRYRNDLEWMWQECRWMLLDAIKIALAEEEKWKKFRAIAAGICDAASGRMGRHIER